MLSLPDVDTYKLSLTIVEDKAQNIKTSDQVADLYSDYCGAQHEDRAQKELRAKKCIRHIFIAR